jgi:hypothetical protein
MCSWGSRFYLAFNNLKRRKESVGQPPKVPLKSEGKMRALALRKTNILDSNIVG